MNESKNILKRYLIILLAVTLALFLALPFLPAVAKAEGDAAYNAVAAGAGAGGSDAGLQAGGEAEMDGAADELIEETAVAAPLPSEPLEARAEHEAEHEDQTDFAVYTRRGGGHGDGDEDDPWQVTSLDIWKDVDVVEVPGTEIGLEKSASDTFLEMTVGEKRDITFTIEVTASKSDAYHIAGNIFVKNTGEWPADVIAVSDTVWYKHGGPAWILAPSNIITTVPLGDDAIPTGGPHVYSYSGTFTLPVPLSAVTSLSNLIEITISNKPDPPKPGMQNWTFHYREDFNKPSAGGAHLVSLEDIESIDPSEGLAYEIKSVTINGSPAASLTGPWSLDPAAAPFTLVITKELTATSAGSYTLNNKARIGELEDEVDVEIVVREEERILGSITGHKHMDLDADGELDEGEPGLKDVVIKLYRVYENDIIDEVASSLFFSYFIGETVTDANGHFSFTDLEPGKYFVAEEVPDGYYATSSNPFMVTVDGEQEVTVLFLNAPYASVGGFKWLDANGNGAADGGEIGLEGVAIRLLDAEGLEMEVAESGSDGGYLFSRLKSGRYTVQEIVPFGYEATAPTAVTFDLLPGERKRVDFFNRVPVGGEVVTPPVDPTIPVDAVIRIGGEQTLPATGFDATYLFVLVGLLLASGAFLASLGAARRLRAR